MDTEFCILYVTAASEAEANRLAHVLVERRLAACGNILTRMQSVYRWQGEMCEASEVVLLLKTRTALADAAQALIQAEHPYECPCIVRLPITGGNPDYLAWLAAETAPPADNR